MIIRSRTMSDPSRSLETADNTHSAEPVDYDVVAEQLLKMDYLHVGLDESLFFAGLRQSLIRSYRRTPRSFWCALRWRSRILARARHARSVGSALTFLVVPEKTTIYPDRLRGHRLNPDVGLARQVLTAASAWTGRPHVLDLVEPFRAERDRVQLYLETDSHWTHAGAHLAYEALCAHLNVAPLPRLRTGIVVREEILSGDLGTVSRPRRSETVSIRTLARDGTRIYANRLVEEVERLGQPLRLGAGAHVIFQNTSPDAVPRRIVLFGDSYCHHSDTIRSGGLTRLLAETFSEVHFIWTTGYDAAYVADVRPDLVLCEIAERYLATRIPRRFSVPA
jgi:hypothetical protein